MTAKTEKYTLTRVEQIKRLEEFLSGDNSSLWLAFFWQSHHFAHDFWSDVTHGRATPYQRRKARKEARRLIAEFKERNHE